MPVGKTVPRKPVREWPLSIRREKLERFAELYLDDDKGAIRLFPATTDIEGLLKGAN